MSGGRTSSRPAASDAASRATVEARSSSASGSSRPSSARMRAASRVATSDWPPRSKKSSSTPTRSSPSTSPRSPPASPPARCAGRPAPSRPTSTAGSGSARRSTLPPAVRGSAAGPGEGGGHHRLGQPLAQVLAQRGGGRAVAAVGHEPRHQPLAAAAVVARVHRRLGHGGEEEERVLHLARLDAHPAHLHLRVAAAQVLQRAVVQPAAQVERAVHPRARRAPRVGEEARRGERRPPRVAARDPVPRHPDLPGHADGRRPQPRVEHVRAPPRDRPADGDAPRRGGWGRRWSRWCLPWARRRSAGA
jgi:hypothetical protein